MSSFWLVKVLRAVVVSGAFLFATVCWSEVVNTSEYQVKAAFIYKFCLYVEWPADAFPDANAPLVLGVAGPASITQGLQEATQDRNVNGRSISVRHISSDIDLKDIHLLFIASSEAVRAPQLIALMKGRPALLVTESPDGLDVGSIINFALQDNRVRFDIGLSAATQQRLRISAQLLQVARSVRRGDSP